MKKTLSSFFIVFVFAALVGSFALPKDDMLPDEKRKRTLFPSMENKSVQQYFVDVDKFAADNFPYRHIFWGGYRFAINGLGDQMDMNQAFRGKDDWRFLGNSHNKSIDKLTGKLTPNPEESQILPRLVALKNYFEEKGVKVVFLLGPQKARIYPEKLPSIIKPAPVRYVLPYMDWLRANGVGVIDPTSALMARKQTDVVYWKQDSHWNLVGSFVAFEEMIKYFSIGNCPSHIFEKRPNHRGGDLTRLGLFEDPKTDLADDFMPLWSPSPRLSEERLAGEVPAYQTRITRNPQAPHRESIWVVGDSFRNGVMPFINHCFAESYSFHIHRNGNDKLFEMYEQVQTRPSYLIIIVTERTF